MGIITGLLGLEARRRVVPTEGNPLLGLLGVSRLSKTGLQIDEEESLSSTAVWSAVTQLSAHVGSLPLFLYKRLSQGGKEKYTNTLYNIMHLEPNPEMTSMAFREAQMGQALLFGTTFAEIERDQVGNILALWPLLTSRMETRRVKETGDLIYRYQLPDGTFNIFPANLILRVNGFSQSGILGYQPIDKNREAIALGMALEEFSARWFGDGATPPAVLTHPGTLGPDGKESLKKSWQETYGGLSKRQRIAVLEEGMKLETFGVSPEDSQAIQARKFQVTEVARIFNMPPHLLKDLERSTYSNIEHQGLEYVIYTIRPWLVRLEQAYNTQLLSVKERKTYFFEHQVAGLLRGDIQTRYAAYQVAIQNGWLNADEVRELENMNPQPNGLGAKYYVPMNWLPKDMEREDPFVMKKEEPEEEDKRPDVEEVKSYWREDRSAKSVAARDRAAQIFFPLFRAAAQKIINRETIAITKAANKHLKERSVTSFQDWLDTFYADMPNHIRREFMPLILAYAEQIQEAAAKEIGDEVGITDELRAFLEEYVNGYSQRHIESSLGQLKKLVDDSDIEELQEIIDQRTSEWYETRADKIALNETVRAKEGIAALVFFSAGLGAVWAVRGVDTCDYCMMLDGMRIKSGESFVNGGDVLQPKGKEPMQIRGTHKHPPLHQGCQCYIRPG